jgi:hypothetical protein
LPETLHIDGVDEAIERGHISEAQRSKLDDADALFADVGVIPEWNPNDVAADVMARSVNAGSLKARHVQHGHMRDLWWRFLAWCAALPQVVRAGNSDSQTAETQFKVPSFSSFWRRWHDKWRALIRFRGQHTALSVRYLLQIHVHPATIERIHRGQASCCGPMAAPPHVLLQRPPHLLVPSMVFSMSRIQDPLHHNRFNG